MSGVSEIQVWNNNAAFDGGGLEKSVDMKASWIDLDHNHCLTTSIESSTTSSSSEKENQNPEFRTPVSNSNATDQMKSKSGVAVGAGTKKKVEAVGVRDDAVIDREIERIEMEMSRLGLKLEALRLEKVQKKVRIGERRGSIVPAKYMEPKQSSSVLKGRDQYLKELKDVKPMMTSQQRRGVSLCPAEIYNRSRQVVNKAEFETGVGGGSGLKQQQLSSSRRQSCFWKLGEIDELKVTKERGGGGGAGKSSVSATVSPRMRKAPVPRFDAGGKKQAATSIGAKKAVRNEAVVAGSVQPKKLFNKEGEKGEKSNLKQPVSGLKKPGRVVASRYNSNSSSLESASKMRLRSSSENEGKDDHDRRGKEAGVGSSKRESSMCSGTGSRVKKRWEIPTKGEVVVYKGNVEEEDQVEGESTPVIDEVVGVLPRIKTLRCLKETPRDSGEVKRVADLVGRKSVFGGRSGGGGGMEEAEEDDGVCQALSFVDEEADDGVQKTQS